MLLIIIYGICVMETTLNLKYANGPRMCDMSLECYNPIRELWYDPF